MGEAKYIEQIANLYDVKISNITPKLQKEVLRLVKLDLTKKEYKSYFQFHGSAKAECFEKLNCDEAQLAQYLKKAVHKLKKDLLKNKLLALFNAQA